MARRTQRPPGSFRVAVVFLPMRPASSPLASLFRPRRAPSFRRCPSASACHGASLGPGRPDDAVEPRVTVSAASPRGARGGLPDRARARRRASIPTAGWPAGPRRATTGYRARGSGGGPPRAAPGRGAPASRAHGTLPVAGGAPGRGVGDRRATSRGGGLGSLPGRPWWSLTVARCGRKRCANRLSSAIDRDRH